MSAKFRLEGDTFVIEDFNQARPFSSFLPGIAGEFGKPMWVFYTNRGQCISSFGVLHKGRSMLEFYPANKAYQLTPLLGFRTFLRIADGSSTCVYEPFRVDPGDGVRQVLRIRAHEIEIEEVCRPLGFAVSVVMFNPVNEALPVLIRQVRILNLGRRARRLEVVDGLPQVVPFGLNEYFLKMMSRTMEAFAEVRHLGDQLPFFRLKVEPSDKPDVEQIRGGFFAFALCSEQAQPMVVDPKTVFGEDSSFQTPQMLRARRRLTALPEQTESLIVGAFSVSRWNLRPGEQAALDAFYGQADSWEDAGAFRQRLSQQEDYVEQARAESGRLIGVLAEGLALHTEVVGLDAYSRQTFLDNLLRGGCPFIVPGMERAPAFHYYSRMHGDMERDYNFFELAPTLFSQGNGNFRDVIQNRRCEAWFYPGLNGGNLETFFNLIQFDGFNPLVIQCDKFYLEKEQLAAAPAELASILAAPFNPGDLLERLLKLHPQRQAAYDRFIAILGKAKKIQDAVPGEGYWIDHWSYNLDLLENCAAVYPDQLRNMLIERRDFTYYDNDHVVQPRHKKYLLRPDGTVRQLKAVVEDEEKRDLLRHRTIDAHKVRTKNGAGPVYQTSLLAKILGLIGIKAASLDPFGVGLEMEADRPGWCDSLNGLPALFGSSVNEAFELHRWSSFLRQRLPHLLRVGEKIPLPLEVAEFLKAVGEALALARSDDFFKTWDTLASLRESFRERTRLGVSGEEVAWDWEEIESLLSAIDRVLDSGLRKAFRPDGLCVTYYRNEVVRHEVLPTPSSSEAFAERMPTVKALEFKQIPLSPFLEGPVHALRAGFGDAAKLYRAVKTSQLYDRKIKMFKLNTPLAKESYEIGRIKIFAPGWLENESAFLHMSYKFMLETLRSGLAKEFFEDFRHGVVAFLDPRIYGRSTFENSSFIVSSRFPDARLHGAGFVARLTGAAAEWISVVILMGLGPAPFQWENGELRFEPKPTLAGWLFTRKATEEFEPETFGFKVFGSTWVVYHNPGRRDTFGKTPLRPISYLLRYPDKRETLHSGAYLPDLHAREVRAGKLARLTIELGPV